MNISFSGDTRDLFKFDLVRHIMKSFPDLNSFTFIPMLTDREAPTKQKKSRKTDLRKAVRAGKAGSQNRDLMEHLGKLQEIEDDMDYFEGIKSYFEKENILIDILHKDRFSHEHRENYFRKMFEKFPQRSLIFLDPDTGLEVKNPTQRHLLFDELKKIMDTMDTRSILMVYQHFPRETHEGYVQHRCSQIAEVTGIKPVSITDNEIVFFLLAKSPALLEKLADNVATYANTYPVLRSCGSDESE
jgi:alpha-acetolactate decarboxylase